MKPSKMFHNDNSPSSKYWSTSNIIRWNRECIEDTKNFMSLSNLAKLVLCTLLFVGIGYVLISWLHPYASPTITQTTQDVLIVNLNRNLSILNSSMTEGEATTTQINRQQKEAFHTSTTHHPSTDVISQHDEKQVKESKSTDEVGDHHNDVPLLTKKYVRLNFMDLFNNLNHKNRNQGRRCVSLT